MFRRFNTTPLLPDHVTPQARAADAEALADVDDAAGLPRWRMAGANSADGRQRAARRDSRMSKFACQSSKFDGFKPDGRRRDRLPRDHCRRRHADQDCGSAPSFDSQLFVLRFTPRLQHEDGAPPRTHADAAFGLDGFHARSRHVPRPRLARRFCAGRCKTFRQRPAEVHPLRR